MAPSTATISDEVLVKSRWKTVAGLKMSENAANVQKKGKITQKSGSLGRQPVMVSNNWLKILNVYVLNYIYNSAFLE